MTFLPRRVIGLVLMVCFAGTPSLLLACAVTCVPGTMNHSALAAAAPDAVSAVETSAHEHTHHAAAGQSASVRTASPQPAPSVTAANLATSADVVGRGCCDHTSTSATTATTTTRADLTALAAPVALAVFISVPAGRGDLDQAHAALVGSSFLPQPSRSPLVLRI